MNGPQVTLNALLSALNAHDLDAASALAPDNERFRESMRRMLTAFPDVHIDAEWTVADAHKAVAWGHNRNPARRVARNRTYRTCNRRTGDDRARR